jgi:hypothetical protein
VVSAKTNAWKHSLACLSVEVDNARQEVADRAERDLGGKLCSCRTYVFLLTAAQLAVVHATTPLLEAIHFRQRRCRRRTLNNLWQLNLATHRSSVEGTRSILIVIGTRQHMERQLVRAGVAASRRTSSLSYLMARLPRRRQARAPLMPSDTLSPKFTTRTVVVYDFLCHVRHFVPKSPVTHAKFSSFHHADSS